MGLGDKLWQDWVDAGVRTDVASDMLNVMGEEDMRLLEDDLSQRQNYSVKVDSVLREAIGGQTTD